MKSPYKLKSIRIYTNDGGEVLQIYSITRSGENLIMDCKVLDAMRIDVSLSADEILDNLKILLKGIFPYVLYLPYFAVNRLFSRTKAGK